jgi:hypothetical protein
MQTKNAKKYLARRGRAYPFCGHKNIEGHSMNFENGEIGQEISCHKCDETWWDVYKLIAVANKAGTIIASISIP